MLTSTRSARLAKLWQTWAGASLIAGSIGAIGCFGFGCCFGKPMPETWYSVRFPTRHNSEGAITGAPAVKEQMHLGLLPYSATSSLPVHPVQLYVSSALLIGAVVLIVSARRWPWNGWFLVAATYYFMIRVVFDPFRGDQIPGATEGNLPPRARMAMALVLFGVLMAKLLRDTLRRRVVPKSSPVKT